MAYQDGYAVLSFRVLLYGFYFPPFCPWDKRSAGNLDALVDGGTLSDLSLTVNAFFERRMSLVHFCVTQGARCSAFESEPAESGHPAETLTTLLMHFSVK